MARKSSRKSTPPPEPAPLPDDLRRRMESLPNLVNGNEDLIRRGRMLNVDCRVEAGGEAYYLSIREGRLAGMERGPALLRSWRFGVRISAEALGRFWAPVPEPGWHDLFALTKRGEAALEGDLQPLMAHLQYFKDLLAAPRAPAGGGGR